MESLFVTVEDTKDEKVETAVKGSLPKWLQGSLIRVGPGKWDLDDSFCVNHWFDGAAMVFKFEIKDGRIRYQSRYADTDAYKKMQSHKRPVYTEFGTRSFSDPSKNVFSRVFAKLVPSDMTDNVVGNVYCCNGDLYAVTETCYAWKIDPESLEAQEKVDLHKITSVNLVLPHPLFDEDGTMWNMGSSFMTGLKFHLIKCPPKQSYSNGIIETNNNDVKGAKKELGIANASIVCSFPSSWKTYFSYAHSFAMSTNYVIFMEQPLLCNLTKLMGITMKGQALKEAMEWHPKEKTRFWVIEKQTGNIVKTKYTSEPFFCIHTINAYEDGDQLVLDIIVYEDDKIFDKFFLEKLRNGVWDESCKPWCVRYVLPLSPIGKEVADGTNLVTVQNTTATAIKQGQGQVHLSGQPFAIPGIELPAINRRYTGKKYRYFYGSGVFEKAFYSNSMAKYDLVTDETKKWSGNETQFPGEPVFVPRPGGTDEDDGVLLSVVSDTRPDAPKFMVICDAKTMEELARAEVPVDKPVPMTFHGLFYQDAASLENINNNN